MDYMLPYHVLSDSKNTTGGKKIPLGAGKHSLGLGIHLYPFLVG